MLVQYIYIFLCVTYILWDIDVGTVGQQPMLQMMSGSV